MTIHQRAGALYQELRLDVYRYLLALGLSPDSAQELTQETFLRLYESLRKGTSIENTRAWLLRVAHNLAVNALLAASNRLEELGQDCDHLPAPQDVESEYIQKDQVRRMQEEMARLSQQQRACMELRAQGLRYREIADVMGISASAVAEFLRRAVDRLKRALDA